MADELGVAGQHFGRAFCLSPDRAALPFESLTPEEQACVRNVGLGWERRVEEAFAVQGSGPAEVTRAELVGQGGRRVGSLTLADGQVTLCLETAANGQQGPRCLKVGNGTDGFIAAQQMLDMLGIEARLTGPSAPSTPSPPPVAPASFQAQVQEHIEAEARDAAAYQALAQQAPKPEEAATLREIAADELKHRAELQEIAAEEGG